MYTNSYPMFKLLFKMRIIGWNRKLAVYRKTLQGVKSLKGLSPFLIEMANKEGIQSPLRIV